MSIIVKCFVKTVRLVIAQAELGESNQEKLRITKILAELVSLTGWFKKTTKVIKTLSRFIKNMLLLVGNTVDSSWHNL